MGAITLTFMNKNLTPLASVPGPVDAVEALTVRMEALDESPQHIATLAGSERRTVEAMAAAAQLAPVRVRIAEAGVGTVAWGLISRPERQVDDQGDTIALNMDDITKELAWVGTTLGYARAAEVGQIVGELGSLPPSGAISVFATGGQIHNYVMTDGQSARTYDGAGNLVSSAAGTGDSTGWSAAFIDQNVVVPSSAPVVWVADSTIAANGNNLTKLTGLPTAFTTAYSNQAQYQNRDLVTNAAQSSDSDLAWQAANTTSSYVMGYRDAGGFALGNARFCFFVHANGTWGIVENGAVVGPSGTYTINDTFAVRLFNTLGTPAAAYLVNNTVVYNSAQTPALPLAPICLMDLAGGALNNAILRRTVRPSQVWASLTTAQTGIFDALRQFALQTYYHVRQGRDATGNPNRTLEFGPFGDLSPIRLIGAGPGDDADLIAENPNARLIESLAVTQDRTSLVNTVTPIGGSGDAPLTLERLWRLIYDPAYPNFGMVGNIQGSVFPEYDAANYPIVAQFTKDGRFEYYVRDTAAYAAMGNQEIRGQYNDPQFVATDNAAAVQELAARGIYAATVAKLRRESQPVWTISAVTDGRGRPPRAGQRVAIDWKSVTADDYGAIVALRPADLAALAQPYVVAVDRQYGGDGTARDTLMLSTNAALLDDGTKTVATSMAQLEAVKIAVQNQTVILPISGGGDVDASTSPDHALYVSWRAPDDLFRWTKVTVDIFLSPLRQQVSTSANPSGTPVISADVEVTLNTPNALNAATAPIAAMPTHFHQLNIVQGSGVAPTATSNWLGVYKGGTSRMLQANTDSSGFFETGTEITKVDLAPTTHVHPVAAAGTTIAHIPAGQRIAVLPTHVHDIPTNLHDTTTPTQIFLALDNGSGGFVELTPLVADTGSGAVGPWSANVSINDIARYCGAAGKLHRLQVRSGANSNQGVGHIEVLISARAEIGGLGSTVISAFH